MLTLISRAFFAAALVLLAPLAASAQQSTVEETRIFGAWSMEVSQHTQAIVSLMETVNEGLEIANQADAGEIDAATARAQAADWRRRVERALADYAAAAETLAQGPDAAPPGLAGSIESMVSMPGRSVETANNYFSVIEIFINDTLEGRNPDPTLTAQAQFSVIQTFLSGVAQTNRQAALTVAENHPQHHLLNAIIANTDALVLIFELARQSYGAAPSHHAVDDIPGEIERLNRVSLGALGQATMAHRMLSSQINASTAAQLGLSEQSRSVLVAMVATYPDSIQAETDGAALMMQGRAKANAAENPEAWEAFMAQIAEYEARRDTLQVERQRLASDL